MAWSGITSRNRDGEPLTFEQTARRWLGGFAHRRHPWLACADLQPPLADRPAERLRHLSRRRRSPAEPLTLEVRPVVAAPREPGF